MSAIQQPNRPHNSCQRGRKITLPPIIHPASAKNSQSAAQYFLITRPVPEQPRKPLEIIFSRPETPKSSTPMNVSQIQQEQVERIFSKARFRTEGFMSRRRNLRETRTLTEMRFRHESSFMGHQQGSFRSLCDLSNPKPILKRPSYNSSQDSQNLLEDFDCPVGINIKKVHFSLTKL